MKRIERFRIFVLLLLAMGILLAVCEAGARQVQNLNQGWRFQYGASFEARRVDYDDAGWENVELPHTFNAADGSDGGGYRRGPGWYRLRFKLDASASAPQRTYLYFDGSSMVTTVWLNGRELGKHWSATSSFCMDATEALKAGSENVLVVRADNTWRDDVPSREGDFTVYGGLYRRVRLVSVSEPSLDLLDRSGPGFYLTTSEVSKEKARVRARIRIRQHEKRGRQIEVVFKLTDASGVQVGIVRRGIRTRKGVEETILEMTVQKPHLWDGVLDPYLYHTVVEIWRGEELIDHVEQPLGFRTYSFDPMRGFILNGKAYELRGANLHQDREGKGWAINDGDREEDLRILREMGANYVRLVHYQHDASMLDLCDRMGFVVWAEHSLIGKVTNKKAYRTRALEQMRELIRRDFNHPSIVMWGVGNEVQANNAPHASRLLERLAQIVKEEDPARPSVLATCFDEAPGSYGVDLLGHNKYFGWYYGIFADFPRWLDEQRAKNVSLCQGMSEYGAGAGTLTHREEPKALDHSEEWLSLFHEAYWNTLRERPWVWCKTVWQMFDSASDGRNEGEKPGINDKGLVTRDRKVRKDAYYWYQAQWTDKPMVYITSRRFTPRKQAKVEVKVYTNCDRVRLFLNGKPMGERKAAGRIANWKVSLRRGDNQVSVEGVKANRVVKDACRWKLDL